MAPKDSQVSASNEMTGNPPSSVQGRSRNGCITCRIRRVKCDEERPHCRRCQSTGRKCDGYTPLTGQQPKQQPPQQAAKAGSSELRIIQHTPQVTQPTQLCMFPGVDTLLTEDEYRALEFFNVQTVSCFGPRAGGWLLNAACQDSAIRRAAMALGTMHRVVLYHSRTPPHDRRRGMQLALQQYNSAIRQGLKLFAGSNDSSADGILSMCVLFFCLDSLQGHFRSALRHVGSGLRILAQRQLRGQRAENTLLPPDVIQSLFAALEAQMLEIDGQSPLLDENGLPVRGAGRPAPLWTLEEAQDTFRSIYNDFLRLLSFSARLEEPVDELEMVQIVEQVMARKQQVQTDLDAWSLEFDHFLAHIFHWGNQASQQSVRMLQLWRTMLTMVLHMGWPPQDTAWGSHLSELNIILDLAEQIIVMSPPLELESSAGSTFSLQGHSRAGSPSGSRSRSMSTSSSASRDDSPTTTTTTTTTPTPRLKKETDPQSTYTPILPRPFHSSPSRFTLALGILPALWTIATQCRDSSVRYRAIDLIGRSKRREGVWDSDLHFRLALQLARHEEQAAGLDAGAEYTHARIPPEARVTLNGRFDEGRKAKISYIRENVRVGEEIFHW
ncbi:protein atnN [Aspergillus nidulans FGSC A4]|uniref:Aspercryptin biosynthesis cluster-specific transcription regulator atnN n=1 Tax=Emericella nidulans (strain FGSC A4 / ATCC 38163 / CBS 112.46 / NRRL 194 / M139) TaxID=227321 RepID=ATNN_EMENI|nr:protein atnN [Aspergillus nidulans FGSC A4]C8V3N0.1 RecName: Full=Aspercryptin biosynthesis cluster-specific transcription regulator atnN; AltName: Full=Aspercryptin biosynthesis cluster protein N [Aspergillus nidulans FGSC A4]CBF73428.1 TPA: Putative Zn(II)2Cys6 transcription factor (Eurofung) [Aspergillus nidulans FGSC A4]